MNNALSIDLYKEVLKASSEVEIYFMLNGMNTKLWETSKAIEHGLLETSAKLEQDIQDIKDMIQLGINETSRFGVVNPLVLDDQMESNEILQIYSPSPDYWKWYKFWDSWKNSLTANEYDSVSAAMDAEEVVPHLPQTSWLDS